MKAPKLTSISSSTELISWLGEVIQEKAGKENAGLVEIRKNLLDKNCLTLTVGKISHTISVETRRNG